ncbi:MAG: hypothetical protein IJG43_09540 [Acidaminococcaceae bacterium]|nr:hypothetical protein [Acidaminococcaceae bacterium]
MRNQKMFETENLKNLFIVCLILVGEFVFFRNVIGHDFLIGYSGDGKLTMLLTEHWYNFFCGREAFAELAFFYPDEAVLGYTDMLLGFGLIHSILRFLGLNMFVAYKYTLIIVHLFGSLCMFYLLHSVMKCNRYWSLFGVTVFSYSNAFAVNIAHTQLTALSLLPLLTIFIIKALSSNVDEKKGSIFIVSALSILAFIAYTAWYIAFFTVLFGLILFMTGYVILDETGLSFKENFFSWFTAHKKSVIAFFLYSVAIFVPFLIVYLPALRNTSGYGYQEVSVYLPELIDVINVGQGNLLFDKFPSLTVFHRQVVTMETVQGFSLVILAIYLYIFFQRNRYREYLKTKEETVRFLVINACIISIVVVIVLSVKLGSDGSSLWYFLYNSMPGAKAIRAVARFWFYLSFPVAFVVAVRGDYIFAKKTIRFRHLAGVILFIALFISNMRADGVIYDGRWRTDLEVDFLTNVTKPPSACKAFYIYDSGNKKIQAHSYQLAAYGIANHFGIKTVNGYSGNSPQGWDLWDVESKEYESNVYSWIKQNDLKDLYGYDRHTNTWAKFTVENRKEITDVFCTEKGKFSFSYGLLGGQGKDVLWTKKHFGVVIRNKQIGKRGLRLSLTTVLDSYKAQLKDLPLYIKLYVNGEYIADLDVINGNKEYEFKVPNHKNDVYEVELKTNAWFCPAKLGMSTDPRELSLAVYYVGD